MKEHPMLAKNQEIQYMAFKPRLDWWVATIFALVITILIAGIPLILWSESINVFVSGVSVLFLVLASIYFIDIAFYTFYVLDRDSLIVTSHIRQLVFPYRTMTSLKAGGMNGLISIGSQKRFALSQRNVIVKLTKGPWRSISVSPNDRELFIQTILERIDGERSLRASRTKK